MGGGSGKISVNDIESMIKQKYLDDSYMPSLGSGEEVSPSVVGNESNLKIFSSGSGGQGLEKSRSKESKDSTATPQSQLYAGANYAIFSDAKNVELAQSP